MTRYKYKGKYPNRIRCISGIIGSKNIIVMSFGGERLELTPRDCNFTMPRCNDDIAKYRIKDNLINITKLSKEMGKPINWFNYDNHPILPIDYVAIKDAALCSYEDDYAHLNICLRHDLESALGNPELSKVIKELHQKKMKILRLKLGATLNTCNSAIRKMTAAKPIGKGI